MKITWLGQAGLLFEKDGFTVLVDPYLSDSCFKANPKSYRRTPIDESYLEIVPDMLILTHNHLDHLDPDTLPHYLGREGKITVLASENGWHEARKYGNGHNYVMMHPGTEWTEGGITVIAVPAEHSELTAIGVIIDDGEKKYYVTGDTLYSTRVLTAIPCGIHAVFLPINGVGNNMNAVDAARFARAVGAKITVPVHYGMFDELGPAVPGAENVKILTPYEAEEF